MKNYPPAFRGGNLLANLQFRVSVSPFYQMARGVRGRDRKAVSWFNRLCKIRGKMDSVFYVRLDFGSGDFCTPEGMNYFAKIEKWCRKWRNLRKVMRIRYWLALTVKHKRQWVSKNITFLKRDALEGIFISQNNYMTWPERVWVAENR